MELNGITWHSPINSTMTLEFDGANGIISGMYHTKPGGMTAPLIGRFNPNSDEPFGWTVTWPKGNYPKGSQTSWVATVKNIKGVLKIESSWMIREQIYENTYFSTVCGCETYTPVAATAEMIEANKHKRPPHPI